MKSPLCSGMRILSPWGKYYEILEVYADDNTPDKPDDIVQPGIPDTPVVISNEEWDDKEFSRVLSNQ